MAGRPPGVGDVAALAPAVGSNFSANGEYWARWHESMPPVAQLLSPADAAAIRASPAVYCICTVRMSPRSATLCTVVVCGVHCTRCICSTHRRCSTKTGGGSLVQRTQSMTAQVSPPPSQLLCTLRACTWTGWVGVPPRLPRAPSRVDSH